jgi:hypothetical protein
VDETTLAGAVIGRIDRWRNLLERDRGGLDDSVLRGLIGELFVLESQLLTTMTSSAAVKAWVGPHGSPQDFLLPSGLRLEVKAISRIATMVRINGLSQLDSGIDPLVLMVVRSETTGASAPGALTVPLLVSRLRSKLSSEPEALVDFDAALACVGWHDHPTHEQVALRPVSIEAYDVDGHFPRLTTASVPVGVEDVHYEIALPPGSRPVWHGGS